MEPHPFMGLQILDVINRFMFGHGVVIYYLLITIDRINYMRFGIYFLFPFKIANCIILMYAYYYYDLQEF